jgi:hypothetical protein
LQRVRNDAQPRRVQSGERLRALRDVHDQCLLYGRLSLHHFVERRFGRGAFATRTLLSGSDTLNFNLYRDAAYSQVWGDGTASTYTVAGTGSGLLTANTLTVYGQVPISQDKPVGTYTSTITVTVTY